MNEMIFIWLVKMIILIAPVKLGYDFRLVKLIFHTIFIRFRV